MPATEITNSWSSYFTWEDEELDFGSIGYQVSQGQPKKGCIVTKVGDERETLMCK